MWGSGNAENCVKDSRGYTLGVAEMQAPLAGKTAASVSLGSSENPEKGQDKPNLDNICKTSANPAVSRATGEDLRKEQEQQRGSRAHLPLGWMRISTGLSKVCLLASVITMLLAERAEGSASARISCVGLSTPARGNRGVGRD